MRKVDDREKKGKIMIEVVATNVIASRAPEPTATPDFEWFVCSCFMDTWDLKI